MQAQASFLEHGLFAELDMLLKTANPVPARNGNRPFIRFGTAQNQLKQGGFAKAVSADQANFLTAIYIEAQILKKNLFAVRFFEVDGFNHWLLGFVL